MDPQDAVNNPGLMERMCRGAYAEQARLKVPAFEGVPHTILDWAAEFRRLANKTKADTFELANAAYLTRKRLAHGEWARLWRSGTIPFSKTRGEALVRIGERFGIPNVQTSAHLPTEWTILYQLSRLTFSLIETLIAQKLIRPELTYKEARELVVEMLGGRRPRSAGAYIQAQLKRIRDSVHEISGQLNWAERDLLATQLQELVRELRSVSATTLGHGIIQFRLNDVPANGSDSAPKPYEA